MPTLYRLLFFIGSFIASLYAAMLVLIILVDPGEKETVIRIPAGFLTAENAKP